MCAVGDLEFGFSVKRSRVLRAPGFRPWGLRVQGLGSRFQGLALGCYDLQGAGGRVLRAGLLFGQCWGLQMGLGSSC